MEFSADGTGNKIYREKASLNRCVFSLFLKLVSQYSVKYQNRESSRSHGQAEQVRMEQLSAENTKLRVYEACVLSTAVVLQTLVVQAPHLKQLVWKL